VVDGWSLPLLIAKQGSKDKVSLTLQRGNVEVTPSEYQVELQPFTASFDSIADIGGQLTIKSLGIAFGLETKVSAVAAR